MVYGAMSDVTLGYQVLFVTLGLTIVLTGVWRLFDPMLPEKRHYLLLRAESTIFWTWFAS
jgi:hypothetical protein